MRIMVPIFVPIFVPIIVFFVVVVVVIVVGANLRGCNLRKARLEGGEEVHELIGPKTFLPLWQFGHREAQSCRNVRAATCPRNSGAFRQFL